MSLFFRIYINLIACTLTKFLDDTEMWCHVLVVFISSWLLHGPGSIIVGILIDFSLVVMYPISKSHVVYIVTCLCLFIYVLVLKGITFHQCYGMIVLAPHYPGLSSKLQYDLASLYDQEVPSIEKTCFLLFEGKKSNGDEIDLFLVHKYRPNNRQPTIPK